VLRVYVGSFRPNKIVNNQELLKSEMADLVSDIRSLPRNSAVRKINETIKRARMCKVHVLVLHHLRSQFGMFGKSKTQTKLLDNLLDEFKKVQKEHGLPAGDFPNIQKFKEALAHFQIHKFPKLNKKQLAAMDQLTSQDIPRLMALLPSDDVRTKKGDVYAANPFDHNPDADLVSGQWVITGPQKLKYDTEFEQDHGHLLDDDGYLIGGKAAGVLYQKLGDVPNGKQMLRKIWDLSDVNMDGKLDRDEYALSMYLVERLLDDLKRDPEAKPADKLTIAEVPPSKRPAWKERQKQ